MSFIMVRLIIYIPTVSGVLYVHSSTAECVNQFIVAASAARLVCLPSQPSLKPYSKNWEHAAAQCACQYKSDHACQVEGAAFPMIQLMWCRRDEQHDLLFHALVGTNMMD